MSRVIVSVLQGLLLLEVVTLLCEWIRLSLSLGWLLALRTVIRRVGSYFILPLIRQITTLVVYAIRAVISIVVTILQLPIDVIWALVPGLDAVPKPDVTKLSS